MTLPPIVVMGLAFLAYIGLGFLSRMAMPPCPHCSKCKVCRGTGRRQPNG